MSRPDIPGYFEDHFPGYLDGVLSLALSDGEIGYADHMPGDPCTSCDARRLRQAWADDEADDPILGTVDNPNRALTKHEERLMMTYGACRVCGGPMDQRWGVEGFPDKPGVKNVSLGMACLWNNCGEPLS